MWPMGHVAVAYILYSLASRHRLIGDDVANLHAGSVMALLVGSLVPDIVDKPLAWHLNLLISGRSLAHSLLTVVPIAVVVILLARRYDRGDWGVAIAVGAISHVLVDALSVLWNPDSSAAFLLWPILSVEPYADGPPTILGLLADSFRDPYFLSEFVLLAIAIVFWRRDGFPGFEAVPWR